MPDIMGGPKYYDTGINIISPWNTVDIVEYHMYSTKVHSGSLCT